MKKENEIIEEILKERIKENENLFNEEQIITINKNLNVFSKIYLLGLINGRQIYGNNLH